MSLFFFRLTRMRVLRRKTELIPVRTTGRKSNDQRMPSGEATIPAPFPSSKKSCTKAYRVTGETNSQEVARKKQRAERGD
jgi:hypothetical protein